MKSIKHICTINDKYSEEHRHLVEINGKNVVFTFSYSKKLESIIYNDIYSFAGQHKPSEMKELIKQKGKSDLNIGLHEYFVEHKLEDDYYFNLYEMQLKFDNLWNKFHNVLNTIDSQLKQNDTVRMFNANNN